MDAHERGRALGFSVALATGNLTKAQFERIAVSQSKLNYKLSEKQAEFVRGFMLNWREPHPKDCSCVDCQYLADDEILTF